jgi:CRISPR-associated exonuclease Cas4
MSGTVSFGDLRLAAYCPRKLYYARRDDDRHPPPEVVERRGLAFEYPTLLDADDESLARHPISVSPESFRANLRRVSRRDAWDDLANPADCEVVLNGKDCRGVVHKVLDDPPRPSLVSAGDPPDRGVWAPQSVHAVAAAKALAYERERRIERAFVEYPAHGIVREVDLTTRRKAAYRSALAAVRSLDGPPPRLRDDARCGSCEYRERCGVRTRSLRSLLP